jgi:type I restriction enzyme R subunit
LVEAVALVRAFLDERGASLDAVISQTGFALNAAIIAAKEAANENDQTRKRFEILCRELFRKYRACLNAPGVNAYRDAYRAIDIIYKSLQRDRDVADISDIVRRLHEHVDEVIAVQPGVIRDDAVVYDISRIDFERLRREFERAPAPRSTVQSLRQVIEQRLQQMMARNPLRADFQRRYEAIVDAYNREKDRATIEQTFEELLRFVAALDEEGERAAREGLDEESLAIFDLLQKPDLSAAEIKRIKAVAGDLLATLKAGKLQVDHWTEKESTRDAVRGAIRDFLWSDQTGLPVERYDPDEVTARAEEVYRHVLRVYPTVPSPYYSLPSAA